MQNKKETELIPCEKCGCQPVLQIKLGTIGRKRTLRKFYKYVCPECKADSRLISETISGAAIYWNEIPHTTPNFKEKEKGK